MVQPTGNRPKPTPYPNDHRARSHGMPKMTIAMTMAVSAPAPPAFGASQRLGTSNQKSTNTGNAAKNVDQTTVKGSS